jgi:hypothetical protein
MTTKDLTQMTPPQVDTIIAGYWAERTPLEHRLRRALGEIKDIENLTPERIQYHGWSPRTIASQINHWTAIVDELRPKLAEIKARMAPYQAEYMRRRWNRYYLVTSSSPGHVHRGMDCSTCYPTTEFQWLVDLAGKSSKEMVAQWGDVACTVCFPEAPAWKEWKSGTKKREAREEKEGGVCPLSGQVWTPRPDAPPDAPKWPTQAKCQKCGAQIKISPDTRKIRKHNYPEE